MSLEELTSAEELPNPQENPFNFLDAVNEGLSAGRFKDYNASQLYNLSTQVIEACISISEKGKKNVEPECKKMWEEISQIFDKRPIKERIKVVHQRKYGYTLDEVIKNPLKGTSLKSMWEEIQTDISFGYLFSKGGPRVNFVKTNALLFASFGFFSVPHELIHAGVNSLAGGINHQIVINTLYGGQLYEKIMPEIESKFLFPLLGGYVKFENPSTMGTIAAAVAPYVLTPLGIYLAKKGHEKEKIVLCAVGAGLIAAHAGGIVGDWRLAGQIIVSKGIELVQETLEMKTNPEYAPAINVATLVAGLYVGSKLLAVSYRAMKGAVNSVEKYIAKE